MKTGAKATEGHTLVELSVAGGVAMIVGLILFFSLSQGVWLFRSNESEMWSRENGSSVIRAIQGSLQSAQTEKIYADYTKVSGTDITYGSCAVLTLPEGPTTITYYWWLSPIQPSAGPKLGNIYSHTGTTAPIPATDKLLASNVTNFEFRRNPNGTVRVGFVVGILGYPRRLLGSIETDLLRFSTSAIPRNP